MYCCQDTTSDSEKELSSSESRLLATLRSASCSSLLESSEAVPVADSSTVSADVEQASAVPPTSHSHVSRPTTRNRLLMQLLAGNDIDTDCLSGAESKSDGTSVTSVPASKSVATTMQMNWAAASSELSEDLNSVNVTDLFNVPDLLTANQSGSVSKLDTEDQLLMAQLEQAIMNSELSLEDLDHLLAVSSAPMTLSSASVSTASGVTDRQLTSQRCPTLLGNLASLFCSISDNFW